MRNIKLKNLIYENKGYFDVLNKVLNSENLAIGEAYKISVIAKALTEKMNTYMEVKKHCLTNIVHQMKRVTIILEMIKKKISIKNMLNYKT